MKNKMKLWLVNFKLYFTAPRWSQWSRPFECGAGYYRQVRFRLSDNKMKSRTVFLNTHRDSEFLNVIKGLTK